jgi:hypothetical protein
MERTSPRTTQTSASFSKVPNKDSQVPKAAASVSLTLPTDLASLEAQGKTLEHLCLTIDAQAATHPDELAQAIQRGIAACPQLITLTVRLTDPKSQSTHLDWVCGALSERALPMKSLHLSMVNTSDITPPKSLKRLCQQQPQMTLHCEGKGAGHTALLSLSSGEAPATRLTLSGISSSDNSLILRLVRLEQSEQTIDIHLLDRDGDAFVHSLMAAGVSRGLRLTVHTADGCAIDLQACLDGLQKKHVDDLLSQCVSDKVLNHAQLLSLCKRHDSAGPLLFALACRAAVSAGLGTPEVPIAETNYQRALRNADVAHVVVCVLPDDATVGDRHDAGRIQALRVELGDIGTSDDRLFDLAVTLDSMCGLKSLTLKGTRLSSGLDSLLPPDFAPPLEKLFIDIDGAPKGSASAEGVDSRLGKLLSHASLKEVVVAGPYAVARLLKSAKWVNQRSAPLSIKLVLPSESAVLVSDWLVGLLAPWLHLSIHIPEPVDPQPLKDALIEKLKSPNLPFSFASLKISSLSHDMPADDRLLLEIARRAIRQLMRQNKGTLPSLNVDRRNMPLAFAQSTNGPAHVVNTFKDPFEYMAATWLGPEDLRRLSLTTKAAHKHTAINDPVTPQQVLPWLERQIAQGQSESHCRAILAGLFDTRFAEQVLALARSAHH